MKRAVCQKSPSGEHAHGAMKNVAVVIFTILIFRYLLFLRVQAGPVLEKRAKIQINRQQQFLSS